MSRVKGVVARLRSLLRPASAERRMEEEFALHVELETVRLEGEGLPRSQARRRALAHFGGTERYREEMREGRRAQWVHDVQADLRYGARMLRKHRGLTLIAVASLAAGIGANAAIFSLVNALLLRPRAVAMPERLVQVYGGEEAQPYQAISYPSYLDFRDRNDVLSGLAAYGVGWQFRLRGAEGTEPVWGEPVSGNYFDVLGVRAYRGRTFAPDEGLVPNRNPVVVIGYALWQRRFAADPAIIGKPIVVNGQALTVIGVAPPEYTGMMSGWASEIWVPSMMMPSLDPSRGEALLTHRGNKWVTLVGRLAPGVTMEQARSRFAALTRGLQAEHPEEWLRPREDGVRAQFVSVLSERETRIHPGLRAPAYALAALLFVAVDLVLVIACLNLAGMLFARGVMRRTEIAVRLALGAGRSRIIRQLLTESLIVSLLAGVAGIGLGLWSLEALLAFMPALPEGIRVAIDLRLDWRVVLYTMGFATLSGLLFGLAPALHASRSALSAVLKDDAAALATRFRTSRARRALVIGQVALSLLLLICAGLMLRSLDKVRPTSLGFPSDRMVVAPIALDENAYDREKTHRFYRQLSDDVAALPGVQAVSLVEGIPGGFLSRVRRGTAIEGHAEESLEIDAGITGPGYFTSMHVPIVLGRDFDERDGDGAPCVAIVNEAFAQRYLGGTAAALGKHLASYQSRTGNSRAMCAIVGVIRDNAWQSLQREVRPFFALPLLQAAPQGMTLLVSTADDPEPLIAAVRSTIQALDPDIPVSDVQTLRGYFNVSAYPFRLLGLVLVACGVMALLLATMGIYGTVSHAVAQRRREVGIRMALGAASADILRLVVGEAMLLVGYGLGAGLLLGVLLTRALVSMPLDMPLLFGVSATDAVTFAGVTLLLALVGLAACWVPALRATHVQPAVTLRSS